MKIEITKKLKNDIFGHYEAIYTGEKRTVESSGMYGGNIQLVVQSGMPITVNTELVSCEMPTLPTKVEGIWSIYAKNPQRGAVLTITHVQD